MSQSAPGWYQDHDDPSLARWWDGERWTEHTLVLDEQDWSTEPDPPQTRFPDETAVAPLVEDPSAGYEADIYAPIRDPWGDDPAAPAPTTWDDGGSGDATQAWGGAVVGTDATWTASGSGSGWGDEYDRPRAGGVQSLPPWAKVGIPLGVLAVIVIAAVLLFGRGGDDGPEVTTDSTTSTTKPASLGEAADLALETAGSGPFTRSTFTTLIPIACQAADSGDPTALTTKVQTLGYEATAVNNLLNGLEDGAEAYCPAKMEKGGSVLTQVRSAVLTGATTSTSTELTVPEDTTSTTTGRATTTTRPPRTTTTTSAPTTTSTTAATTTTTEPPTTSTTTFEPDPD